MITYLRNLYLICKNLYLVNSSDTEGETVRCANIDCPEGREFHLICANLQEVPDEDWHCSATCANAATAWCCQRHIPGHAGTWVGCQFGPACPRGEWFHLGCIGLDHVPGVCNINN